MPYKDKDKQREHQRERYHRIRSGWFADKVCAAPDCGSTEDLQLDHIDPKTKVSHRIWSWSQARRDIELAKCQVLCEPCHKDKTREFKDSGFLNGSGNAMAKLNEDSVRQIRELYAQGIKGTVLAKQFGVHKNTIYDAVYHNWTVG